MNKQQQEALRELYRKYLDNQVSREEFDRLCDQLLPEDHEAYLLELMTESWAETQPVPGFIMHDAPPAKPVRQRRILWTAAAAAAVAAIAVLVVFFRAPEKKALAQQPVQHNGITLTLADGAVIDLDSAANGAIGRQGNTALVKLDSGSIAYTAGSNGNSPDMYNMIATPRGKQFRLVLPDGSAVWLNTASSLRFPAAFTGKDRTVELTGEAYFEIAGNTQQPFYVNVGATQVQVLGTHFNIMAYGDEPTITTTLLQGAVKVKHNGMDQLLHPGQQAACSKQGMIRVSAPAAAEDAVAWKNGYFRFDNADIYSVMRQLARWYDVEVTYEGSFAGYVFAGDIQRGLPLSGVLAILEMNRLRFRVNGKKIVVMPM